MRICSYAYASTFGGICEEYREFLPHPALAPYVSVFWSATSFGRFRPSCPFRVLPDGCTDILFSDDALGQKRGAFIGAMTGPLVGNSAGISDTVAVRFRPGGAFPFTQLPLYEVTDSAVPWDLFFPPGTDEIEARLAEETSTLRRIDILERFLFTRLATSLHAAPHPTFRVSMQEIIETGGQRPVSRLVRSAGCSERHLTRIFRERAGLSPKRVCELTRFLNVVQALSPKNTVGSGATLAADHGYFDQSHLIKEFQRLAGLSPTQLSATMLRAETGSCPIFTIQDPARLLYS